MTTTAEIHMPKVDAATARLASEQLALVLLAKLLDHRLPFTVAAGAAVRSLDLLRNIASGFIGHEAAIAISLDAQNDWTHVYGSMADYEKDPVAQGILHFAISVEALVAELMNAATGKTLDAKLLH